MTIDLGHVVGDRENTAVVRQTHKMQSFSTDKVVVV